jgi:hypothetical protein
VAGTCCEGLSQHLCEVAKESNEAFYDSRGRLDHPNEKQRSVRMAASSGSRRNRQCVHVTLYFLSASYKYSSHIKLLSSSIKKEQDLEILFFAV